MAVQVQESKKVQFKKTKNYRFKFKKTNTTLALYTIQECSSLPARTAQDQVQENKHHISSLHNTSRQLPARSHWGVPKPKLGHQLEWNCNLKFKFNLFKFSWTQAGVLASASGPLSASGQATARVFLCWQCCVLRANVMFCLLELQVDVTVSAESESESLPVADSSSRPGGKLNCQSRAESVSPSHWLTVTNCQPSWVPVPLWKYYY